MLHIGCSDVDAPGFIKLDARPLPHVHFVRRDITRLTMIPDAALDMVYMCHVLEHVMRPRIVATLKEMAHILRPGGLLRLSVPDFDRIVRLYEAAGRDIRAIAAPLVGGQDYAHNIHYVAFNRDFLADQLLRAGFVGIADWHPHACAHHDFEDWASRPIHLGDRSFPVSLNLEAHKP
ncbi:class I SAM-dependent methyltransferase [Methyloversatilis thermotolerans]|uniref:class I SAM-dependent methyltransferase n=1 Tax=Methyloversatilis thermotolerans TaxID=1346290 RepID=UPI0003A229B1|nr:methyltransferase domain-containing protein [Methyloversatilis thermotolerans]